MRRTLTIAMVVVVGALLLGPGPARGTPAPVPAASAAATGVPPVYASDAFKSAARRILKQFVITTLRDACDANQPLCASIVERTIDAADAAISRDDAGLLAALNALLTDASINGVLQTWLGDLFRDAPFLGIGATRAERRAAELAPAFVALARCLSSPLTDARVVASCTLAERERKVLAGITCEAAGLKAYACGKLAAPGAEVQAGVLRPATALALLADLVASPDIERTDLRVYLLRLGRFLETGIEGGLFEPTLAYLTSEPEGELFRVKQILEYDPARPSNALLATFAPDADPFRKALQACKQELGAYDRWVAARDRQGFMARLRRAVVTGERIDLAPLADLAKYECAPDGAGVNDVRQLRSAARYLRAALDVRLATLQYGAAALAAAAVLDYVRTEDLAALDADLRRAVDFALVQQAERLHAHLWLEKEAAGGPRRREPFTFAESAKLCEVRLLRAALAEAGGAAGAGAATATAAAAGEACFSLATWRDETLGARLATLASARRALVDEQVRVLFGRAHLALGGGPAAIWLEQLGRASQLLVTGSGAAAAPAARKAAVRVGIELLLQEVLAQASKAIGDPGKVCSTDTRTSTVFSPVGATCATRALVEVAYRPIADVLWKNGASVASAPDVAKRVHVEMARSPFLSASPIILNVGMGGHYIRGIASDVVWGADGYGAVTLLDKIGLAFYKFRSDRWTFETGPFVGGFLDAIVRTATDEGEAKRSWLAGYTVGFPRLLGLDVGVELHGAIAMPFALDDRSAYGYVLGGAVVAPLTMLFEEE